MSKSPALVAIISVFALSALGVASASAAEFHASATGTLEGKALESQVLTTNGGEVICSTAASEGPIKAVASTEQFVTVNYSGCKAFSFAVVHVSPWELLITSNGQVHLLNMVTITLTIFGVSVCTVTFGPETFSLFSFANSGTSKVKLTPNVTGITYTSSGGSCGSSGSNGTYKGASEWNRSGGGTLRFE